MIEDKEFALSSADAVAETLVLAGIEFDPSLVKESISYYDGLIHFTEKGKDTETLILSLQLRKFCWWRPDGKRNSGKS